MKECRGEYDKKIKSYCIKDDKIFVNYLDSNEKDVFLYNEDIELDLINRMEKELLEDKNYKSKSKYKIRQSFAWFAFFGLFSFSTASSLVKITTNIFMWFSLSITCFVSILNGWDMIKEINNIRNINKMSNYIKDRKSLLEKSKTNDKTKQNDFKYNYSNTCIMSNNKNKTKKLTLKK